MTHKTTPVLVVGAGPSGLTASLLLSRFDIPHILIDKRNGPIAAPAAHVVNRRSMEIFRQAGLPMEEIYALDRYGQRPLTVRWAADLSSPTLSELDVSSLALDSADLSKEHLANISQYRLEAFLLAQVQQCEGATVLLEHQWVGFTGEEFGESLVRSPDGETISIRSDYLLAADGAGSPIRSSVGIEQSGPANIVTFLALSVQAKAPPDVLLNWCLDPKFSGVTITHDPDNLTVYMRQIHEPWESEADFDDGACMKLLLDLFKGQDIELLRRDVWRMTAQVADQFRSGSVFLIGDAAHRFPPTGGLGLNSGVADAHNLVWKIASHLKGAPDQLLDTYEQERKPVVQKNCNESLRNFRKMDEVIEAMGLDPNKAGLPARILATAPIRFLPKAMRGRLLSLLTYPIKRRLERCVTDPNAQRQIQAAADNQRAHFDMPHLELGYVYSPGFAIADVNGASLIIQSGSRVPHIAVTDDGANSLQDLLRCDGYTLISAGKSNRNEFETFGLPMERIDTKAFLHRQHLLNEALELKPGGWILVRPDGHIAAHG